MTKKHTVKFSPKVKVIAARGKLPKRLVSKSRGWRLEEVPRAGGVFGYNPRTGKAAFVSYRKLGVGKKR